MSVLRLSARQGRRIRNVRHACCIRTRPPPLRGLSGCRGLEVAAATGRPRDRTECSQHQFGNSLQRRRGLRLRLRPRHPRTCRLQTRSDLPRLFLTSPNRAAYFRVEPSRGFHMTRHVSGTPLITTVQCARHAAKRSLHGILRAPIGLGILRAQRVNRTIKTAFSPPPMHVARAN